MNLHPCTGRGSILKSLLSLLLVVWVTQLHAEIRTTEPVLEKELTRLAATPQAVVGVAAIHLESGRSVIVNRGQRFPMASTYKIPIAVQVLRRVDQGELQLDARVVMTETDVYLDMDGITDLHLGVGASLRIRDLINLSITVSDNNASDVLLRLGGGAPTIRGELAKLGYSDIFIDRPTSAQIATGEFGWVPITSHAIPSPAEFVAATSVRPTREQRVRNIAAFAAETRDTTTTEDMLRLLLDLWNRKLLSAGSTDFLLQTMYRTQTGRERLKGMLPRGTRVAHKTGTLGNSVSDVGIMDLPAEGGHVAIAVYVKESTFTRSEQVEALIASIARATHDYFVFVR